MKATAKLKKSLALIMAVVMMALMIPVATVSAGATEADTQGTINLETNRVLGTQPTLQYADEATTKYKPGYVLHNMDFSKITDWESTGYFVANDAEPVGFELKDGNLRVNTMGGSGNVQILFTGNSIPKNIQDYTVNIRFRFTEPSTTYRCYIHGTKLDDAYKTMKSGRTTTCFRYDHATSKIDNASHSEEYNDEWDLLKAAYQKGEWIDFTYSAIERNTAAIVLSCDGHTVKFIKTSNTIAELDTFMGITVGGGSVMDIASIQVVAGHYEDYESLIWPGEENALVQTVTQDATYEEITLGENNATKAYFQTKEGSVANTADVRFLLAVDVVQFTAAESNKLTVTFLKDGATVATRTFTEINTAYSAVYAAGDLKLAADGVLMFGFIVTGVPDDAWDSAAVTFDSSDNDIDFTGTANAPQ